MLRLIDPGLDANTVQVLASYQAEVDQAGDYAAQVDAGRRLFRRRNTVRNPTFVVVRDQLQAMTASPYRCGWCEDSEAGQIDHVRPKALYPEHVFAWANYVPACGICNLSKGDRFAVLSGDSVVDVTRRRGQPVRPPRPGESVVIDPRSEDPLMYMELDMATFWFLPKYGLRRVDGDRAKYTIRLLDLNREALTLARRNVFGSYRALLLEYCQKRDDGTGSSQLEGLRDALLQCPHPTVWREMQRQHEWPPLDGLFEQVPEALSW